MNTVPLTLANAAAAQAPQPGISIPMAQLITLFVKAVDLGAGVAATLNIESLSGAGDWHVIQTINLAAGGLQAPININGPHANLRANLTAWTKGAITVTGYAIQWG